MTITAEEVYVGCWLAMLAVSVALVAKRPADFEFCTRSYWRFLLVGWKLATAAIAIVTLIVVAPYSGDPTWDAYDSVLVGLLVFLTAPWAVAAMFLAVTTRERFGARMLVGIALLLAPSWAYDVYIFFRDGAYPPTWLSNLGLSPPIGILAGLFWNLGWSESGGTSLTFRTSPWPPAGRTPFRRVVVVGCLFAVPFLAMVAAFLLDYL